MSNITVLEQLRKRNQGETFALLLPGGKKIALGGYKDITGPARKGDQTTWIDFPASTGLKVNQMILQIGKDTEEQLLVPLTGHADLSQYQPRQSTPNLRVAFGSMFWTLKTVTLKLSDSAMQVGDDSLALKGRASQRRVL